ncbi:hypothetical protein K469DRAFT_713978 [Zopfia rhizophila CBS 207.26]|uniref:Uncharacterized protein n=1 Tax=Zopfia rhizophila CBS 207.26 TaxID=1314779 RepID=A0A6A6DRU8_9PEZI|nr:hypothetical protein K469DRAFT_713978 [Zopfia rhizophila CBS 207.26]
MTDTRGGRTRKTKGGGNNTAKKKDEVSSKKTVIQIHISGLRATKPSSKPGLTTKRSHWTSAEGVSQLAGISDAPTPPVGLSEVTTNRLTSFQFEPTSAELLHPVNVPNNKLNSSYTAARSSSGWISVNTPKTQDFDSSAPCAGSSQIVRSVDAPSSEGKRPPKRTKLSSSADQPLYVYPDKGTATGESCSSLRSPDTEEPSDGCPNLIKPNSRVLPSPSGEIEDTADYLDDGIDDIFESMGSDIFIHDHQQTDEPIVDVSGTQGNDEQQLGPFDDDAFDDEFDDDDLGLLILAANQASECSANGDSQPQHTSSDSHIAAYDTISEEADPSVVVGISSTNTSCVSMGHRGPSSPFISPAKPTTRRDAQKINGDHIEDKPIVRSPFPSQVRDRSPVIGLSANTLLRTCFRVGEALNAGCQAARNGKNVMIELYAKVVSSWREPGTVKQHFVFCDLFHSNPPYITGCYELWKGVELWDYDSGRFMQREKKMCRCIGKMKREGKKLQFVVLNIWECNWEDIAWVEGVVCG